MSHPKILIDPPPSELRPIFDYIISNESLNFLNDLWKFSKDKVNEIYILREKKKLYYSIKDILPDFKISNCRQDTSWKVKELPERLKDRRLDLGDVSPSNTNRFVNSLNQPVQGIQVDFDDGHCPNWPNQLQGIYNVILAVNEQLPGVNKLLQEIPLLILRPRAWNIIEHHVIINGEEIPGPIFDVAMLLFHCGKIMADNQIGPYFYLSKMEGSEEAHLWNEIFIFIQRKLNIPLGTIKACVLIENILSVFEMEEILWELKDHSLGLNCGIWDYAASIIAKFGSRPEFVLPDRNKYVNMEQHFMKSYMRLVIDTCHKRGAHATGGMAAQTIYSAEKENAVINKVIHDKKNEILNGVDGFMVFDEQLVPYINNLWKEMLPPGQINQLNVIDNKIILAKDLLSMPKGGVTLKGLRHNICVSLLFIYNWSFGEGQFCLEEAVEDSATAEISRFQIWQWIRHQATLEETNTKVTRDLVKHEAISCLASFFSGHDIQKRRFLIAYTIFIEIISKKNPPEYITTYLNDCFINRENLHDCICEFINCKL